jgi:sucrose-phosphate synthase
MHEQSPLYIILISIHGLIRGHNLELGRDADTGGQTKYVVDLARALGKTDQVARVDLLTRRVIDSNVDKDYAQPVEPLSEHARIIRIDAGPDGYIRKEELWDYLDNFADNTLDWLKSQERLPDILHSHYADAGYVGVRLSNLTAIPLIHTGHSLGRDKRRRLVASGLQLDEIDRQYKMSRRIDAEEDVLANAELVITSSRNEIKDQYEIYDFYQPERMTVIPPGIDLDKFYPPQLGEKQPQIAGDIRRFLDEPDKAMILALSRPDARKNIANLVQAYGESEKLQRLANLVIIAGNRDDIRSMEEGPKSFLTDLLVLIDFYDLYGKVAMPKHHSADEVPAIYRLVAASGGVFVNPALTEPFGLTLLEAAASGVPLVATENGGPEEIIGNCQNGILIDPLDVQAIGKALRKLLGSNDYWRECSSNGLRNIPRYYSWQAHAESYLARIEPLAGKRILLPKLPKTKRPMQLHSRAIFSDIDLNLVGDPAALKSFTMIISEHRKTTTFGITTGRRLDSALSALKKHDIPMPDVLITSLGTEIYYAPKLTPSSNWSDHIDHLWNPKALIRILADMPGLVPQSSQQQSYFKISYHYNPEHPDAPSIEEINSILRHEEQTVNVIYSFGQYLDIVPIRASKGLALRYVASLWDIQLENILVAGGSGADEDIMRGNTLAVVVANRHKEELSELSELDNIYFAKKPFAAGILEALDYYDFFNLDHELQK